MNYSVPEHRKILIWVKQDATEHGKELSRSEFFLNQLLNFKCLIKSIHLNMFCCTGLIQMPATFRLQYENDYEYDFSVLSTRCRFGGRKMSKCACSNLKLLLVVVLVLQSEVRYHHNENRSFSHQEVSLLFNSPLINSLFFERFSSDYRKTNTNWVIYSDQS